jgi:hypothetical protein
MRDNRDELILIDGEYYSHNEIRGLIESNHELAVKCERQTRFINALKLNNGALTVERNNLIEENRELKYKLNHVTLWDLSPEAQEEAGHALARSLLGKPMTDDEVAIEAAENGYKPYVGDDF